MDDPCLKLTLTERAYNALVMKSIGVGIDNPLPLLRYNQQTREYEISARGYSNIKKLQKTNIQHGKYLVYQVGRINVCFEDQELVSRLKGKMFDYWNGRFLLKDPEILDEQEAIRDALF